MGEDLRDVNDLVAVVVDDMLDVMTGVQRFSEIVMYKSKETIDNEKQPTVEWRTEANSRNIYSRRGVCQL